MSEHSQHKLVEPAIRLHHISKIFGGIHALNDVSFEVNQGEVHCLAGENGCGKSTLIKIITGVYTPENGAQINCFGQDLNRISPAIARDMGIAVIWQDLALFSEMSVAENIAFEILAGSAPKWVSRKTMRGIAEDALGKLNLNLDLDKKVGDLPIAERQMVAIARALAGDAKLIFMDEPTASLTQSETNSLLHIVNILAQQNVAIVFVSHRLAEVLEISSRVTVLRDGKLVGVYPTEGMTQSHLAELMTGKSLDYDPKGRDTSSFPTCLKVTGLSRQGEFNSINFELKKGEVLGLTGLIGAGRTELASTLFGMTKPDDGSIMLETKSCNFRSNRDAIDAGIAYLSEDRLSVGLIQEQSISSNTIISVLDKLTNRFGLLSLQKEDHLVDYWVEKLSVKIGKAQDAISTLSGGNQQRIGIAKWLATEPKVLILDSPTVGVDVGARAGIFKVVRDLSQSGLSILLISDEPVEVHTNCDRILHMKDGQLLGEYNPHTISLQELESIVYA
ncbi:sugar ABC transporter ATP-binding protein [Bartonella sp. HY329]|uniref:sugar ABC transporter ATP-binding protein n=1 Tax=unclassified Bartonella TaxID=2645622 RepID=UPI0021C959DC|nr:MULTISPECIES: sugar ABC transporter ATP-binding protein [unclassified Bartonella]UXM94036.1 sugar ABC transporter ATP-binding protein [Bartonella sp. HY329]UXN08358.1 sugar ABC transporter ATP-binding protein [Bartonella sp. HY328]